MLNDEWVLVDTETTGLSLPICAVEIAAQRMKGWHRNGPAFRVLLNHDVAIEPMAEAVHGYSRDYLRQYGEDPRCAHLKFYNYASDLPLVAYNLSYDWDRVLEPEYRQLGVRPTGRKGFCAMTLSRRSISGSPNYKLETLKSHFGINTGKSHRGRNDVETLTVLFEEVLSQRLEKAGLFGFAAVAAFSRQIPVARCLEQVLGAGESVWYYVDAEEKSAGPFTAAQIRAIIGNESAFVWREGMLQWTPSNKVPEFCVQQKKARSAVKRAHPPVPPVIEKFHARQHEKWIRELIGICRGIVADGQVNGMEVLKLREWLLTCPCTQIYPVSAVAENVEKVVCDGIITAAELADLKKTLESAVQLS